MVAEPTTFSHLQPGASTALATAIESMEPSAAVFESTGLNFQLAQYLATVIKDGTLDLNELRSHGLSQNLAVEIATAISKRHARRAAAIAAMRPMPVAPKPPVPAAPAYAPESREAIRIANLSLLHDLAQQIESGRGDLNDLVHAGYSLTTARELAAIINRSRTGLA